MPPPAGRNTTITHCLHCTFTTTTTLLQMIRESGQPPVNKPAPPDAPPPPAPFLLPPEACQAVVEALASQLLRVVLRAEEVAELPAWADSQAEYKELCSNFR